MRRRPDRPRDSGAAAVEFALLVPLLVLFLIGIISYGFFFFQATSAEHASREAARLAAVGNLTNPTAQVQARAQNAGVTGATVCTVDDDGVAGFTRGDAIQVRVTWRPAITYGSINFPFGTVPFIDDVDRVETAVTSVERSVGTPMGPIAAC